MTALRLLRAFGIWNAGEIAGFPDGRAAELIRDGLAERHAPPPVVFTVPASGGVLPPDATDRIRRAVRRGAISTEA